MSLVVWIMMGIAVWHFTVFVPDRFWGGIVGAFLAAIVGAALFGFVVNGATFPGRHDTELVQALIAIPGSAIGLLMSYLYGSRVDRAAGVDHGMTRAG
jgi:ABC-type tungstate transport system substrate-binding protein